MPIDIWKITYLKLTIMALNFPCYVPAFLTPTVLGIGLDLRKEAYNSAMWQKRFEDH